MRYFLSPSIQWCFVNERCVILDVDKDRYLQVSARDFASILSYLPSDRYDPHTPSPDVLPATLRAAADELLAASVLTLSPPSTPRQHSPPTPRPTEFRPTPPTSTSLFRVMAALPEFALACATADYCLRYLSLKRITMRIIERKRTHSNPTPTLLREQAIALAHCYRRLRPFYPRNYLCLFDSLALLEFLAIWGIYPSLVFGVIVDPFLAHCWVQYDNAVLCDTACSASRWYSPIMAI